MPPNLVLLDATLPDVARLLTAMVQAHDAVESRSWSHPQEPTTEEWWADVLADSRARIPKRRSDYTAKQAFYRLADELIYARGCPWAWSGRGSRPPPPCREEAESDPVERGPSVERNAIK